HCPRRGRGGRAGRQIPYRRHGGDRMTSLTWRREGLDWVLLMGRRRFGRVVPDIQYPGMWRSKLSGGRLSDMSNLAWAKNAVLVAAEREAKMKMRRTHRVPLARQALTIIRDLQAISPSSERGYFRPFAASSGLCPKIR